MNRIEFMTKLEALLRNVSVDERKEAIQYYNDYFDDAGSENEDEVIKDLGSPERVAATIKAGLKGPDDEFSEFSETGYTDTRFDKKDSPARRGETGKKTSYEYDYNDTGYNAGYDSSSKPKTDIWKVAAIILIVIVAAPIVIPVAIGLAAAVFGVAAALFAVLISFVIAMVCVAVVGIILVGVGIPCLVASPAAGLGLIGAGLIVFVIGMVGTVLTVKLCMMAFPPMIRFIVDLVRKLVHRKGETA